MTKEHTPTPWKVYLYGGVQIGQEDTGEAVCSMWGDKQEGEANASHIVKCVNMHDELVEALVRMKQWCEDEVGAELPCTSIDEALKKAGAL